VTLVSGLCTIPGWFVLIFLVWGVIRAGSTSGSTVTNKDRGG
jgi:hypothetical protein